MINTQRRPQQPRSSTASSDKSIMLYLSLLCFISTLICHCYLEIPDPAPSTLVQFTGWLLMVTLPVFFSIGYLVEHGEDKEHWRSQPDPENLNHELQLLGASFFCGATTWLKATIMTSRMLSPILEHMRTYQREHVVIWWISCATFLAILVFYAGISFLVGISVIWDFERVLQLVDLRAERHAHGATSEAEVREK